MQVVILWWGNFILKFSWNHNTIFNKWKKCLAKLKFQSIDTHKKSQPYISRCLGSGQHLKNKFGSGYLLEIKLKSSCAAEDDLVAVDRLDKFVNDQFPDASQIEKFGERMIYKIPQSNITSLSATFTALEEGRDRRVGYCEMCWISYDMNS